MNFIRIWNEIDIEEMKEHIVMVDDISGFCPNCKKIGISLKNLKECPECNREFKYVSSKEAKGGKHEIVTRTIKKLPELTFIDYDDYHRLTNQKAAEGLFNV